MFQQRGFFKGIIVATLLLFVAGCGGQRLPIEIKPRQVSAKRITPFVITEDGQEYILADFLPIAGGVDSIVSNSGKFRFTPVEEMGVGKGERFKVEVEVDGAEGVAGERLGTVILWREGVPTWQMVIDRRGEEQTKNDATPRIFSLEGDAKEVLFSFTDRPERVIALWQTVEIPQSYIEIEQNRVRLKLPREAKRVEHSYITLYAECEKGIFNDILIPLYKGAVVKDSEQLVKNDPHRRVMYSLLIDRFEDGKPENNRKLNRPDVLPIVDYMGGDFVGITQKIKEGYFKDLGVNVLWISPITRNPDDAWGEYPDPHTRFSGYHGYWPIYTTVVDDRFGTEQELRELLDAAHQMGMEVILDYVANHLHIDSPVLREHPDWTTPLELPDGRRNLELWDEHRLTTWFDLHIPSLDLGRKEVYEPMTDSAMYWLENFDFDGFRHDATKHIPEEYWRTLTQKINSRIDRPIYQIGETYGSPQLINSYVSSGMLDGQFDFNVYDAAIWNIIPEEGTMKEVGRTIEESLRTYGYHNQMGYISGNHDRPRFISLAGGSVSLHEDSKDAGWKRKIDVGDEEVAYDRLLMLEALMLALPGTPCIYQADEYGEPGGNDPDNRRMMRFDGYNLREREHKKEISSLIKHRTNSMELLYGTYIPLYEDKDLLVFGRVYMGDAMVFAINRGRERYEGEIVVPEFNKIDISVPAMGYAFKQIKRER